MGQLQCRLHSDIQKSQRLHLHDRKRPIIPQCKFNEPKTGQTSQTVCPGGGSSSARTDRAIKQHGIIKHHNDDDGAKTHGTEKQATRPTYPAPQDFVNSTQCPQNITNGTE